MQAMPIVDYFTDPDAPEHREALRGALDGIALEDGSVTSPVSPTATVALSFPEDFEDEELQVVADRIRKRIVHVLGDEATEITFTINA